MYRQDWLKGVPVGRFVASVRNVNGRGTDKVRDHHHEAALETLTEEPNPAPRPLPPGLMGQHRPSSGEQPVCNSEQGDDKKQTIDSR